MGTIHMIATWSEDLKVRVLEIRMELPSLTPSSRGNFCYYDHVLFWPEWTSTHQRTIHWMPVIT